MSNLATTEKGLLDQIKTTFLTYKATTLNSVVTYKKAVLPPIPAFPAIAIMPESDEYTYWYGKNTYHVERQISVEVFDKQATQEAALKRVESLIVAVKDIFQANNQWSDLALNSTWSSETYSPPIVVGNGWLQGAFITLKVLTEETQSSPTPSATVSESNLDSVKDAIYDQLAAKMRLAQGGTDSLYQVHKLYKQYIPPIPDFPTITVTPMGIERLRTYAGIDVPTYQYSINIFSKLLDKEVNLDLNLDIMEIVINILQTNQMWGGKTLNGLVYRVVYYRDNLGVLGNVYRTEISYFCKGFEYGPFT